MTRVPQESTPGQWGYSSETSFTAGDPSSQTDSSSPRLTALKGKSRIYEFIHFENICRINHRHIKLVIGDYDRRQTEQFQETRTIEKVFIRNDFVKRTFNNDIALIKLKREVSMKCSS